MDWRYSPWLREAREAMGIGLLVDHLGDDRPGGTTGERPRELRGGFLRPGSRLVQRLKERSSE